MDDHGIELSAEDAQEVAEALDGLSLSDEQNAWLAGLIEAGIASLSPETAGFSTGGLKVPRIGAGAGSLIRDISLPGTQINTHQANV